jgi:hypothetical protein
MCWPHVNPVPSGAVGKDCQRRLLSRPRFVRAVVPRIIIIIIIIIIKDGLRWEYNRARLHNNRLKDSEENNISAVFVKWL